METFDVVARQVEKGIYLHGKKGGGMGGGRGMFLPRCDWGTEAGKEAELGRRMRGEKKKRNFEHPC